MVRKYFILFSFSVLIFSCVSKSEHDKILSEKEDIIKERDKLKQELEDIKFGASNLLADGKIFYDAKDYLMSRVKFQLIVDKHPDMPQSIEAKKYLNFINEEELWQKVITYDDISNAEEYISKYPNGKFIDSAFLRKEKLEIINMQKSYDEALSSNSSLAWKNFLDKYPEHPNKKSINEMIIRREVDEISGNSQTGSIPSFDNYSSSNSLISSVEITNDTGCDLIVRYSGVDAKMIEISAGRTKRVNLSSGSYKITASACGANYAGTENLHGSYGSTFYISTTRF
jgi:hypothetical protein